MATYKDNNTAMVIFSKANSNYNVEAPNTINPSGTDIPFSPPQPNTPNIPSDIATGSGSGLSRVKGVVVGLGLYSALKSTLNYAKNNYGEIMQDSNAQAELNETLQFAQMGMNIGMGFAVGGVIGGVASIISTGVNVGLQTASYNRMMHRNSVQSEIMMARTQYASINGGR